MAPKNGDDRGFAVRPTKDGEVAILRYGAAVTLLRGDSGKSFLAEMREALFPDQQQLMARITGNYKRGNERLAASHPRNRR